MNSNCYTFKKIIYDNVLLDNVEATYIIHLKDNGRLEDIQKQLKEYQPTKIVYIVFNEGFKKCKKPEFIILSSELQKFDQEITCIEKNIDDLISKPSLSLKKNKDK